MRIDWAGLFRIMSLESRFLHTEDEQRNLEKWKPQNERKFSAKRAQFSANERKKKSAQFVSAAAVIFQDLVRLCLMSRDTLDYGMGLLRVPTTESVEELDQEIEAIFGREIGMQARLCT